MSAPVDPRRCPLCREPNACGMADGGITCWCFATKIPADVLESVPPDSRDKVCVCEACATGKRARDKPLRIARTD
jgi:hypothetical protein